MISILATQAEAPNLFPATWSGAASILFVGLIAAMVSKARENSKKARAKPEQPAPAPAPAEPDLADVLLKAAARSGGMTPGERGDLRRAGASLEQVLEVQRIRLSRPDD